MLLPLIDRLWKRERMNELRAPKKVRRVRLRVEGLEDRVVPYSMAVSVVDPQVEPGQELRVAWRISRDYIVPLDDNGNDIISKAELSQLTVKLLIPGVTRLEDELEKQVQLGENAYFVPEGQPNAGDLKGFGTIVIPADANVSQSRYCWVVANNQISGSLERPQSDPINFIAGQHSYARTTFATGAGLTTTTINVTSRDGFPSSGVFYIATTGGELMRVTGGAATTTWTVERGAESSIRDIHYSGEQIELWSTDEYVRRGLGTRSFLTTWAGTLNYDGNLTTQLYLEQAIALQELRVTDAIPGGNLNNLPGAFAGVVNDVYGGNVAVHKRDPVTGLVRWDASRPTIILVHGIRTHFASSFELGSRFQQRSNQNVNIISFYWGYTGYFNGLDRFVTWLINSDLTDGQAQNLSAAVGLNSLVRLLDTAYERAGVTSHDRVNIVAHSQGTVVTTAALMLKKSATELARVNQVLFVGANLDRNATKPGREYELIKANGQLPHVTSLWSDDDVDVIEPGNTLPPLIVIPGRGGGHSPFFSSLDPTLQARFHDYNVNTFSNAGGLSTHLPVVHSSDPYTDRASDFNLLSGEYDEIGWWNWLLVMQGNCNFLVSGVQTTGSSPGFSSIISTFVLSALYQTNDDGDVVVPGPDYDQSDGFPNSHTNHGSLVPLYDDLQESNNGGNSPRNRRGRRRSSKDGILTVVQGDYFFASAINPRDQDPGGYITQFLVYADLNGNGSPDDNELIARDFHPGNGWKCAVFTSEVPLGTFTLLGKVLDNDGMESIFRLNTFRVIAPGGPPPDLPPSIDANVSAQYSILMHRNGDIDYDPQYYTVGPGRAELWEVTPQNGGGFSIETTGTTDTVIGLYLRSNGQLLAFDEDNGSGSNAQLVYNLASDTTYVVAVVSENGSSGNYGFHITGINQTITADIPSPAPLYDGFVAEAIDQTYEMDYYRIVAPANATSLDVILDVSANLDGYVRVEDSTYETVATSFLSPIGEDDLISGMPVTPGGIYYITVASRNGTTGGYNVRGDFSPDDDGFPDEITPPTDWQPLVLNSWGELTLEDQQVVTGGQFVSYLFSPRVTGDYTFETLGNMDTQIGIYTNQDPAQLIDQDDDSGGGENARLTVNLTGANDYFVIVRGEGLTTGYFDLLASGVAETPGTLTPRGLESMVTTNWTGVANNGRYLHYQFTAPDIATSVDLTAEIDPGDPQLDIWMRFTDSLGNVIRLVDFNGPGVNEQRTNIPITGGDTYFVTLYGHHQTVGDTRLTIDCNPNYTAGSGAEICSINTTFFGGQEFPGVDQNASGYTVVAWSNRDVDRLDAQRFDANGSPIGGEFQINQNPLTSIVRPVVAVAPNNSFVVAWAMSGFVYYRCFDANANPLTGDLQVNASTYYTMPRIDMAADGSFVIAYSDGLDVFFRQYDASGNPLGVQVRANTTTTGDHYNPDIVVEDDGKFLIVWQGSISSNVDIYAQAFATNGSMIGSEFRINTTTAGNQMNARLDVAADDTKVVVWQSENQDGSGFGIIAQHLAADNSLVGAEVPVNTFTTGDQTDPEVSLGSQGKFLVIWVSTDDSGKGIAAQQFGVNGVLLGPEFTINQTTLDDQDRPALSSNGVDKFFTVWNHQAGGSVHWDVCGVLHTLQEVFEPELKVQDSVGPDVDRFIDFGSLPHGGGSVTQFVTISNTGNMTLNISNLELYGADAAYFTLDDASPFNLAPSAGKQLQVTFDPRDYGTFFVGLRFNHNDTVDTLGGDFDANPYWVSLLGDVPFPAALIVEIDPASFAENAGTNAAMVTVTRINTTDFSNDLVVTLLNSDPTEASVPITVTIPATQSSYTFSIDAVDDPAVDGPQLVTITASAAGFTDGFASVTVTDNDSNPPTVAAGADASITAGGTFDQFGSFTDADSTSGWTGTVDYGDGSGVQPLTLFANKSFELNHVYAAVGTYPVTVTVTDNSGAQGSDPVTVTVDPVPNNPPTVTAGNDAAFAEGGTFTQSGSFTDPDNASGWTATVDYGDGGGQQNLPLNGQSFDLSHLYADNGVYTITVRATDSLGAVGTDTVTVTVNNVAPSATFGSSSPGIIGQPVTFTFTNPFDPSSVDTAAGFLYSYDFNNDGDFTDPGDLFRVSNASAIFTFSAIGTHTVMGQIEDKDGDTTNYTTDVIVNDVYQPPPLIVVGTDKGGEPLVRVLNGLTREVITQFVAYPAKFRGGVRVAVGDVDGDGSSDIIVAPGAGGKLADGARSIRVFHMSDGSPMAGSLGVGFMPFGATFAKGLNIAAADFDGDGKADLVCAPSTGLAPRILVISGADGQTVLHDFTDCFPNEPAYRKGIRVAAGDVNGDGKPDVVAHSGSGSSSLIRVFNGETWNPLPGRLGGFNPFVDLTKGNANVSVAVGDLDDDGKADIIAGTGKGANLVRTFHGTNGQVWQETAGDPDNYTGGIRVAITDADADGKADIVTGTAKTKGLKPHCRVLDGESLIEIDAFFVDLTDKGGVFVGGAV